MQLRYYQQDCIKSIFNWYQKNAGNPICSLATGTGKSIIIAHLMKIILEQSQNERIVCCIDTKELVDQNLQQFIKICPFAPVGVYSASLRRKQNTQIIFAGIQSIYNKGLEIGKVDLLIVDECHMVSGEHGTMWQKFIFTLKTINPKLRIIGFTATPYRMDSGLLHTGDNRTFDGICYEYPLKQGIADGYLSEIIPKGMATKLDVSNVSKRGGEFIESQLQKAVNIDSVTISAIHEIMDYGQNRKAWLVFSSGVKHAHEIEKYMKLNNVPCAVVDGKTPIDKRDAIVKRFKDGELKCLINNAVFTKGFDAPNVDMIACLRPTNSPVLWLQMVGRGLRLSDGKENCLLLDFAQNIYRFGPLDKMVLKDKKRSEDEEGVPPMKECPKCQNVVYAGVRICSCGFEFPPPEKKIDPTSANKAVLSNQEVLEDFIVNSYSFSIHKKQGKPDSLKITYAEDMITKISEFICIGHSGFARTKAVDWWRKNTDYSLHDGEDINHKHIPSTAQEAYDLRDCIKIPKALKIYQDGRFMRIKARSQELFYPAPESHNQPNPLELDNSEIPF